MTLSLRIRPDAESDLAQACRWYTQQAEGLTDEFLAEVERTFRKIEERPGLYPKIHKELRRALTRRFPFGVFYVEESEAIVILAVMHQARDPERWKERS